MPTSLQHKVDDGCQQFDETEKRYGNCCLAQEFSSVFPSVYNECLSEQNAQAEHDRQHEGHTHALRHEIYDYPQAYESHQPEDAKQLEVEGKT